jgi:DNA topoisomerase-6 subunit B
MSQSQSSIPVGPLTVVVHLVSVWPPFTSEAKEAIANYPEIYKQMRLALQECGRKLGSYVNKKKRVADQQQRMSIFENYIPELAEGVAKLSGEKSDVLADNLRAMLAKTKEFIQANKVVVQEVEGKGDIQTNLDEVDEE